MIIRVIDFETTGLDDNAEPCQFGTVDLEHKQDGWVRGRMLEGLIDPGIPIEPGASGVHDITDADVAGKPKWLESLKAITSPPPNIWCAHNNRFDQRFFNPPGSKWIDAYRAALWIWPDAPDHKNTTLRYWLKLKLAPPDGMAMVAHQALADAYITAAILRRMLKVATIEELLQVSSRPAILPRFIFGKHAMEPIANVPTDYLEWIVSKRDEFEEDVRYTANTALLERRRAKK